MEQELKLDLNTGIYSDETKELLKTDPAVMIEAIKANNNSFTLFAAEEIDEFPKEVLEFYFYYLCFEYHGAFQYYYTLRILHLLLKDSSNIMLFHSKFIDEQFIKKAFSVNPEIKNHIPYQVQFFTSNKVWFKVLRVIFKFIQTTKASL